MSKTVPSFRTALEFEIIRWKSFRNELLTDEEKLAFDEIMNMCRNNAMAGGNACRPIVFELMAMSILLGQQIKRRQLERRLDELTSKQSK